MRHRLFLSVALLITSLAFSAHASRVVAQIEFAKSTLRITSASNPATQLKAPAPQQPNDQNLDPAPQLPDYASPRAAAPTRPAQPAAQYPVRQATYTAPTNAPTLVHAPNMNRAPSTVNVYSSSNAQSTLSKMPRPAPVQPRGPALPMAARGKPFQSVPSQPVVSPYLNMYRGNSDSNNLPNYFTLVRPQLQQQEANRQQAAELQKLRGQLQNMSSGSGAPTSASMTTHAHYMDTAQFYKGMRR